MTITQDSANIALFGTLAADWWDPNGQSKLLHRINPARLAYVREAIVNHFGLQSNKRYALKGLKSLDIGCGAGLIAEPICRMGADVQGLDAGADVIFAARAHAAEQGLPITYHQAELVEFAQSHREEFDFITCLEVVEHVTDIPSFVQAISSMLKPSGLLVFSTPNRTPASWTALIAGAEYILRAIPKGGHDWKQFVTPDELTQMLAQAGLRVEEVMGLNWSPVKSFHISANTEINYIGFATKV